MKGVIIIAWRNIWRNRKRSLATIASIWLAIFLALLYAAVKTGSGDMIFDGLIKTNGAIGLHKNGYWDKKSINNSFVYTEELNEILATNPNVKSLSPKLENFTLISTGEQTKTSYIIGVVPELEKAQTNLSDKLIWGNYFDSEDDKGIILSKDLAKYLKVADFDIGGNINVLNDSIFIYSSGYQGVTVAEKYRVKGIVDLPTPVENKTMSYLTLNSAQEAFSPYVPNILSSLSIELNEISELKQTQRDLLEALGSEKYELMRWDERYPEMVEMMDLEEQSRTVIVGIIYLVVGLGMFGTILMGIMERRKEIAVMRALGMSKLKLSIMLVLESLTLGIAGVMLGCLFAWPMMYYYHVNPIELTGAMAENMLKFNMPPYLQFACNMDMFMREAKVVFGMSILVAIYPIFYALKEKITESFHQ
ncbi:ABC transporter permease [Aureibacter tunicatorum]|uniref:ABC-type lipoprotein release transport system permease subunit n=1 Tax=Aureibacter tunicatorum TaxID=866807 RepID=A0AAE3XKY7_9BACT|nr:FtsX-like permease family protein [Aureibacter tunicatorum]MDR6238430.1 ABC-type lipoprotein release transport system permease subunit [Aureibacter tunicatorum]BDD03462.1 transporter [Aureibacter tunicatorum]